MATNRKRGLIEFEVEVKADQAAQEYAKLEKSLQALQREQKKYVEGSKEYKDVAAKISDLNKNLKDLNPTYEQLTKTKKTLEQQLKRLTPGTAAFIEKSKEVEGVTKRHAALKEQIDSVSKAQKNAGDESKKAGSIMARMKGANPFTALMGPLGALFAALGALFAAFSKSEKGSKLLTQGMAVVNGIISRAVALVNNFIGTLQDIFTKSETPFRDLGQLILSSITNRLKAAWEMLGSLGGAFVKFVKGDFAGVSDELKKAGEAMVGVVTGLDKDAVKEEIKAVEKSVTAHVALANAKRNSGAAAAALAVDLQKLVNEEERLNAIADDATLSFKQREEAAAAAALVGEARARKEIELSKSQLALLNQEINLRKANGEDVSDLIAAQGDARAAVLAAEGNLQNTVLANETMRRQLLQDRLEIDLDILIDGYDFRKTILERQFNDERTTYEQRKALQEEIIAGAQLSFDKQIGIIEQFAKQNVNVQELLRASEDGTLENKVRSLGLSEIIETRLLEIVKERSIALQDFEDLQKTIDEEAAQREAEKLNKSKQSNEAAFEAKLLEFEMQQELEVLESESALQTELEFLERKRNLLREHGLATVNIEHEIAKQKIAIADDEAAKKIEAEKKVEAQREAAWQRGKDLIATSFDFFIEYLGRDEKARKKNAETIKKFEKAKILVNLATEVSNYWKGYSAMGPLGIALAVAQSALAGVRAYTAIQAVNAQEFARGGRVGKANIASQPNGDNVLATLKTGEVVLTEEQQQRFGGARAFALAGVPGFAAGGAVGRDSFQPNPGVATSISGDSELLNEVKALRKDLAKKQTDLKAFVVYDEFEKKKNSINNARKGASW